jgi:hypothetical protein
LIAGGVTFDEFSKTGVHHNITPFQERSYFWSCHFGVSMAEKNLSKKVILIDILTLD